MEPCHFGFDFVGDLGLQISKVPIALRKTLEQRPIECELGRRIDRIEAVLFVNQPAQHQAPTPVALFEKIVKAPSADDVADDAVDRGTLRDRHLSLRDRARTSDFDGATTEKMQNAHAARPAVLVCFDELLEAALTPCPHHAPPAMPNLPETIP